MPKSRIFLAYSSEKQAIADGLKTCLQDHFEVVPWRDMDTSGGILLDSIVKEIESCQYGVAILSCDSRVTTADGIESWVPVDNVMLEAGFFLGHFGRARTALITVIEGDGRSPRFPTDLNGWVHLYVRMSALQSSMDHVCEKIRRRFSAGSAETIPTLASKNAGARGFNILTMSDARSFWGKFEGRFVCLNPSWTMEHRDPSWLELHEQRYQNPAFVEANYIIDIDRGRDSLAHDRLSTAQTRVLDPYRDLRGMVWYINEITKNFPSVKEQLERKLRIFVRPGVRSELTTFISECNGYERALLFVRRLNDNTVLEARAPEHVEQLKAHVYVMMSGYHYFKPSEIGDLCRRMGGC